MSKSKLRKPKSAALGPQYRGSKVGRDALASEDEDDPFGRGFEGESSEDEDGDVENGSDDEDALGSEDEDEDMEEGTDATDLSEDEDEMNGIAKNVKENKGLMEELKRVQKEDANGLITKSLSIANKEEAEKGRSVKRQRTVFDTLLSTRMKLQKCLVATNTLVGTSEEQLATERQDAREAMVAAEMAAFNLWNSLNSFREELIAARTGKKRKRPLLFLDTPTEDLWAHLQAQEAESRPQRDVVLKKWSAKAQGPSVRSEGGRLNQTQQATIVDVLQEHLSNPERLLARAHAPRSCAPLQLSQRVNEDPKIYDDADFYGLLLKELLEQKSQDSVAASNIDLGFQMRRETKTKRNVDTKASKGRKLRYTVHEKLQNYMAPEDRTRWSERQADELFGSLFGQRLGLAEQEEAERDDEDDGEEAGLMMFRS